MKKTLFPIVLLSALFAVVSCSKSFDPSEDGLVEATDAKVFTASIENSDTKTDLADKKVNWVQDDEISINGGLYTATPRTDATQADFSGSGAKKVDDLYKAYYPSVLYNEGTPTLPSSYTYNAAHPFEVYPMYAQSENTSLKFSNICGALAITVKSSVLSNVKSITVSSSNCAMSGAFSVEETSTASGTYKASLTSPTTVANTVILNCGESGVATTSGGTVFYIPIPAQTYQNIKIVVTPASGNSLTMVTKKDQDILVARNTIYPINFNHNFDNDPGKFSVGYGKQVEFSKGNLYWDGNSFEFNDVQYNYCSSYSQIYFDHFRWAANSGNLNNDITSALTVETSITGATTTDVFFTNADQTTPRLDFEVAGEKGIWRTLSNDELTYILGRSSSLCKYHVKVCNVADCLILAPDGYDYNTNPLQSSYDDKTWQTAEAMGLVCLPAAGIRNSYNFSGGGNYAEYGYGYYWLSTPVEMDANYAYRLVFWNGGTDVGYDYNVYDRNYGFPVRLVRD